ncbi:Protocadherin-9, partial [Ophiophagus hannah]
MCKLVIPSSQRRVTFHLPDGSQESCSDSGLGDHEPSSNTSMTHPLPLGFPQEEYYEQTSPNSRTEGDGNSDPESITLLGRIQRQTFHFDWAFEEPKNCSKVDKGMIPHLSDDDDNDDDDDSDDLKPAFLNIYE